MTKYLERELQEESMYNFILNTVQWHECAGSLERTVRKLWNKYRTATRQESVPPCQEIWDLYGISNPSGSY